MSNLTTRSRQWRGPPFWGEFWGEARPPYVNRERIARLRQAATPMDPNGWRFSHPYYSDPSVTFEVQMERVQARWQALHRVLAEQTQHAIACSGLGWIQRETADVDDESVQSERDDIAENEGEQDDHLDRFKSRTRYHQEVDEGIARADAVELQRASAKGDRVVSRKKQPKLANSDSEVAEEAFLRSGNLRLVNIFDPAPVKVDEDDIVNVSRLSLARPTFSTEEAEPVASAAPTRLDNRWRPTPCVIRAKWTAPPRKKRVEPSRKKTQSLTPAEERDLFEILQSGRENPEYNRAWTKVIEKSIPLIWSRVRYYCKSRSSIIPEDVYAYAMSKIFEHKKIDKFNPNRGKLVTLIRAIVKSCFIDYTRTVMVPVGLVGEGIKNKDQPPIRTQSLSAVDDIGVELGESLDASKYGAALFPDWEAPTLPNNLLTPQEHRAFNLYLFGKPVSEISEQIGLSSQRVYQLIGKAKKNQRLQCGCKNPYP